MEVNIDELESVIVIFAVVVCKDQIFGRLKVKLDLISVVSVNEGKSYEKNTLCIRILNSCNCTTLGCSTSAMSLSN